MRYKEFNPNRVLEKCILLFWKNGFRACAISDIVETTKVNRFSLYEEFGNKEGILFSALKLYKERYANQNLGLLDQNGKTGEVLTQFYSSFYDQEKMLDGCFIIHVGTELADTDETVKAFLKGFLDEMESRFVDLLDRDPKTRVYKEFFARNLVGLFCTSMSFCLIYSEKERSEHIRNGIDVILNKELNHA